ncbi:MAG: GNAT family N-acetyltransferase [Acidimicrobiia bacterium]
MSTPLELRIVSDVAEFDRLRAPWNAACDASVDANVFLTWEWLRTWWEHFGAAAQLHVITMWERDDLVATAPLMRSRVGVGPVVGTFFESVSHDAGDYGGIVLVRREEEAVALLLGHLEEVATSRGHPVVFSRLVADSHFVEFLRRSLRGVPGIGYSEVPLDGSCPYTDATAGFDLRKAAKRHKIGQRLRRLEERHREVVFEHHTHGRLEAGLDAFLEVHRRRWAGETDRLQGLLADPASERFLLDAIRALDIVGRTRLLTLSADGRPIAVELDLEYRSRLYMLKGAFDPDYGEFSPGQLVNHRAIADALQRGITEVDFMRGGQEYKRRWANGERTLLAAMLSRRGVPGRLDRGRTRAARSLRRRHRRVRRSPAAEPTRRPETLHGERLSNE